MLAGLNGQEGATRALLAAKAAVNLTAADGSTALMRACDSGAARVCSLLLDAQAEVNYQRPDDGFTALMWASQNGQCEAVLTLLGAGAQIDTQSEEGWSAVGLSSAYAHEEVAPPAGTFAPLSAPCLLSPLSSNPFCRWRARSWPRAPTSSCCAPTG